MNIRKIAPLAALITAASLGISPASASSWQINQGSWVNSGSVHFVGPTTVTIAGIPEPCPNTDMGFTLSSGTFSLTSMSFAGSTACTGITFSGPASVSAPVAISGSTSVSFIIEPVTIRYAQPAATCTFRIKATMSNANPNNGGTNSLTFTSDTLSGPCTNFRSTGPMMSNKPVRAVFP